MSKTWILIANSSNGQLYSTHKARLFQSNGRADDALYLLKEFHHAASREKTTKLVSDRRGNYQGSGSGRGSFMESTNPKEYEADLFARELAEVLETGRTADKFDDLIIVATPHFQGLLHKHLNNQINKLVSRTIEKDYTHYTKREVANQLRDRI